MFTGSHPLTVDEKGRLAIPARYRQQLTESGGNSLVMTRTHKPCIEIYPASAFQAIAEQIQNLEDREAADLLKEVVIGYAVETEVDKQGRILLPQVLRRYARLDANVRVVGQISRFDVWDESLWADRHGETQAPGLPRAVLMLKR